MITSVQPNPESDTATVNNSDQSSVTAAQTVDTWMEENGITDPATMTREQIASLIKYLKEKQSSGEVPGLSMLIKNLESSVEANPPSNGTSTEKLAADLKLRAAVLNELSATAGTQTNPYQAAASKVENQITQLDALNIELNSVPPSAVSDPAKAGAKVDSLIQKIDALEESGVDVDKLGLGTLRTDLQAARETYNTEMEGVDPESDEGKLAMSRLQESFYQAKVDYYTNTDPTGNSDALAVAKAGARSEELRQTKLLSPWEDTTADPEEMTIEGIDAAQDDLELQYEIAVAEGDKDAMGHIKAKMAILERARGMLENGDNGLLVGVVVFQELRMLDITAKKVMQARLREEASTLQQTADPDDPAVAAKIAELTAQADALDVEIESITKQLRQIQDQYESALSILTQNTNESLSKAL